MGVSFIHQPTLSRILLFFVSRIHRTYWILFHARLTNVRREHSPLHTLNILQSIVRKDSLVIKIEKLVYIEIAVFSWMFSVKST